jgi:fructooligosaccharide transport system substrate-binding protein
LKKIVERLLVIVLALCIGIPVFAAPKKIELQFYGQTGNANTGREVAHSQIFDEFEKKHPNIKINAQFLPWGELIKKLVVSAAGQNPPDVFYVDAPLLPKFASSKVIAPMDKYYSEAELNDMLPMTREDGTYNGKFYGPAESQSAMALFYNKKMFAAAGIEVPTKIEDAWTWEETLEILKKMTKVDKNGRTIVYGLGLLQPPSFYDWGWVVRSKGTPGSKTLKAISSNGKTVKGYLDTPEAIEGFQFIADIFNKWKVAPKVFIPDMLETGKCAAILGNESLIGNINLNYPGFEYGIAPLPYFKTKIVHTGSLHYCLSAKTGYPKETAELIKFMGGTESSILMFHKLEQVPALKSVYAKVSEYDTYPRKLMKEQLYETGAVRPRTVGFMEYDQIFTKTLNDIIAGADVKQSVKQMVNRIDMQLKKY